MIPTKSRKRSYLNAVTVSIALLFLSVSCVQAAPKFEYKVVLTANLGSSDEYEQLLNQLGNDGWELIEVSAHGWAVFKRPK